MRQLYYAFLNIIRGRGSNVTKVLSLSLGLTIGILLFSQIAFELNYERCYPDADRLALVGGKFYKMDSLDDLGDDDGGGYDLSVFDAVAAAVAENFPDEVESATCINQYTANGNYYYEDKLLKDIRPMYVDTCFFQTMGIPVLKGNPKDLIQSDCMFVSESFARRLFGGEDPIGRRLSLERTRELTVRGVYRDMPENTMFYADFVVSIHRGNAYADGYGWKGNDIFYAIFRARSAEALERVNKGLTRMAQKYTPLCAEEGYNGMKMEYDAIPLPRLHTLSDQVNQRLVIYAFLGFAIFFVAIMNYMLIVIANLSRRAKSVGVHKCSGAGPSVIFGMFLWETALVVLMSVVLSFFIIFNAESVIEDLLSVKLSSLFSVEILWVPMLTVLILFILAGVIPGRMFSRIPVTQVFRRYTDGKRGWKRSLLFVQFTGVSFVLGLLMVALLQYNHLMNYDMGIRTPGLTEAESWLNPEIVENVRDEIRRQPMVEGVTTSSHSVLGQYWTCPLNGEDGKRIATLNINNVQFDYPEVMGITLLEGKPLTNPGDLLVNENVIRRKGWTDGAIGKKLDGFEGSIVGVFKDVRNQGVYAEQQPIVLEGGQRFNHAFNVRLKAPYDENLKRLNEYMEQTFPNVALTFRSVDSMIADMYYSVYRFRNSVWITSAFILLIVIMGLIGYVNDETQRRSKEIAVRKVNGAEASDILRLLTRDILYVAVPSVLMGVAVSYWVGKTWLEQFADVIPLHPLLFAGIVVAVLILVVACVVIRAWKIANENPVLSIKAE